MNAKQSGISKVWVLAILVVAAAGALIVFSDHFPPTDENVVSGSIVPAERYRNNQIGSEDVILEGEPTSGAGSPVEEQEDALVLAADKAEKADNAVGRWNAEKAEKADNLRVLADKAEKAEKAEKSERAEKADQLRRE